LVPFNVLKTNKQTSATQPGSFKHMRFEALYRK